MCPFDFCRVTVTADDGPDKAGLTQGNLDAVPGCLEDASVCAKCLPNERLRVVKIIQVFACARRIGFEVQGGGSGQVAGLRTVDRDQARNVCLLRR